jgi:DnaK suppressor protein
VAKRVKKTGKKSQRSTAAPKAKAKAAPKAERRSKSVAKTEAERVTASKTRATPKPPKSRRTAGAGEGKQAEAKPTKPRRARSSALTRLAQEAQRKPTPTRYRTGLPAAPAAATPVVRSKPARTKLTAEDLAEFRAMLLEKRAQLVGDVQQLQDETLSNSRQEATGDLSSMPIHMADIGSDNWDQEFNLVLLQNERGLLREIDEALARIEDGTFGLCLATGKPISKTRLRAKPWAKYCIEYARLKEAGHG